MKVVKTLALVASTIGFANVGLSLPAHSQQVVSNQATQTAMGASHFLFSDRKLTH